MFYVISFARSVPCDGIDQQVRLTFFQFTQELLQGTEQVVLDKLYGCTVTAHECNMCAREGSISSCVLSLGDLDMMTSQRKMRSKHEKQTGVTD